MNEETKMNKETKMNECANVKKNNRKWWCPMLAAIGLVVALVTGVMSSVRIARARQLPGESAVGSSALQGVETKEPVVTEEDRMREAERIRTARKAAVDAYRVAVEAEYEAFKRRVAERSLVFDTVRVGIPGTVGKYDFQKCWTVMYALAKDKLSETTGRGNRSNFDALMNADLRAGFYQPLLDARGEMLALLDEFQVRLLACRDELDRKLTNIPDWNRRLGEVPASLKAESLRIEEVLRALQGVQIGATVAVTFDAACVAGVCQIVSRLLAAAATRFAAGAATGLATAMADSPLPGPADVAGVCLFGVGVAATAWEVRKATKVIPEQLSRTMNETVDAQCAEIQRRVLDEGEKLYLIYVRQAAAGRET